MVLRLFINFDSKYCIKTETFQTRLQEGRVGKKVITSTSQVFTARCPWKLMITIKDVQKEAGAFSDFNLWLICERPCVSDLFMDILRNVQARSGLVETETFQAKRPNYQRFIVGSFGHLYSANRENCWYCFLFLFLQFRFNRLLKPLKTSLIE